MKDVYIYKCWCGDIVLSVGGCVPPNLKKIWLGKTPTRAKEIILFSAKLKKWVMREIPDIEYVGFVPMEKCI